MAFRVKSTSPWYHLLCAHIPVSGEVLWLFQEIASNIKDWGIWAKHEAEANMTEQSANQLLKSVAVEHISP